LKENGGEKKGSLQRTTMQRFSRAPRHALAQVPLTLVPLTAVNGVVQILIERGVPAATLTAARGSVPRRQMPDKDECLGKQATCRSGANPDDRNRDRDTQAKRAENRHNELRKQICLGPHIR
jgi:hypothetical protein